MQGRVLQLVAVGNPPPGVVRELEEPLLTQLGVTIVMGKQSLPTPTYAFNKDRNQYHSNAIMRRLPSMLEPTSRYLLGITDVDLFIPDSPFIFGEADREARVALMSVHRLRPGAEPDVARRRTQVEATHQAGHLLGLSYCEEARCVMFLATAPTDCDRKGLSLCNLCRNELAKLNRG